MTKAEISSEDAPKQEPSPSDLVTDPTTGPSVAPDHLGRPLVVLKDVDKHFGQLHVLQKINLTVRKGEVVVILGPSGSGKSTLCRVINRLETIESGTVTVDASHEGHADVTMTGKLTGGDKAILGRAVVVGAGQACGVVATR